MIALEKQYRTHNVSACRSCGIVVWCCLFLLPGMSVHAQGAEPEHAVKVEILDVDPPPVNDGDVILIEDVSGTRDRIDELSYTLDRLMERSTRIKLRQIENRQQLEKSRQQYNRVDQQYDQLVATLRDRERELQQVQQLQADREAQLRAAYRQSPAMADALLILEDAQAQLKQIHDAVIAELESDPAYAQAVRDVARLETQAEQLAQADQPNPQQIAEILQQMLDADRFAGTMRRDALNNHEPLQQAKLRQIDAQSQVDRLWAKFNLQKMDDPQLQQIAGMIREHRESAAEVETRLAQLDALRELAKDRVELAIHKVRDTSELIEDLEREVRYTRSLIHSHRRNLYYLTDGLFIDTGVID